MKTGISNEELFERYISGDKHAMNDLFEQNIGLIKKKCKAAFDKCGRPSIVSFDDLFQEASVAFVLEDN